MTNLASAVEASVDLVARACRGDINAFSGVVELMIKPPVNAEFDLESFSGDIESCFGPQARDKSKYVPGSELHFTQGGGGARVMIQTLSGEIKICDR